MAGRVWTRNFNVGRASSANIVPDFRQDLKQLYAKEEAMRQETERRQKEFDDARKSFLEAQNKELNPYLFEKQFDDTGITDIDSASEKMRAQVIEQARLSEFAYRNGFIDEEELRRRNSSIMGQVKEYATFTENIQQFTEDLKASNESGVPNPLNDKRLDLLSKFDDNFAVSSGIYGLGMSTLSEDGKRIDISPSAFNRYLQVDKGVDYDKIYTDLIADQGYNERISQEGYKVTSYVPASEEGVQADRDALDVQIDTMSDAQIIGALYQQGLKPEGDETEMIVDPKATDADRAKLKTAMYDGLKTYQKRKRVEELYTDPMAVARERARIAKQKDPLVKTALIRTQKQVGSETKDVDIEQFIPVNAKGINFSYIVNPNIDGAPPRSESEMKVADIFYNQLQENLGVDLAPDAIKNMVFKSGYRDVDTGEYFFDFAVDYSVPGTYNTSGRGFGEEQTRSKVLRISPSTLEELNTMLVPLTGKPVSNTTWQKVIERQEKQGIRKPSKAGRFSGF